jgi:hypothetical protein
MRMIIAHTGQILTGTGSFLAFTVFVLLSKTSLEPHALLPFISIT